MDNKYKRFLLLAVSMCLTFTLFTPTYANTLIDPAGEEAYACREDIHPQDPDYPEVHVASLEEAPNGDLLYSFYAGTREKADDVATYMARLPKGSTEWEEPKVIFDEPDKPDGNAVLWNDGHGKIHLFFSTIMGDGWTEAILRKMTSEDNGLTWSEPTMVREEWGWLFGTKPFRMSNDEVIVPIYNETNWSSGYYISDDNFRTWYSYPENDLDWPRSPNGAIQPATVELEPGHLLTYMRTRDSLIYKTESFDYGRTWTEAEPTDLPNNNSRVALLKLNSGNLLLAYNPVQSGRSPLRLALSEDGGETWSAGVDVETEPGAEFSYPYLLQTSDGSIHLAYTHRRESMRHIVFNETFVRNGSDLPSNPEPSKLEYYNGQLKEVDKCKEVDVEITISTIRDTLEYYRESGDLKHPLYKQLSNRLNQAEHQEEKGRNKQAIKHMQNFLKHLNNNAMEKFVSDEAKIVLNYKVKSLIDNWSK